MITKPLFNIALSFSLLSAAAPAFAATTNGYYGIPEAGVERLTTTRRTQILQDLEQRIASLAKMRKQKSVSVSYSVEERRQERLLRRVQNAGITHYRAPEEAPYKLMWDGTKLVKVPVLTPKGIQDKVDAFEYDREVRMSPEDCSEYRGERAVMCRYLRRIQDKPKY